MSFGNSDRSSTPNNAENIGDFPSLNSGNTPPTEFIGEMPSDFDPNNLPEDFSPENMPGDFDFNNIPQNEAPETDDNTNNSSEANAVQPQNNRTDRTKTEMPQSSGNPTSDTSPVILLVISAIVLLVGIVFALKFKK